VREIEKKILGKDMAKGYIEEPALFGHGFVTGFGDDNFCVKIIDRNLANKTIIKNHYSHKIYNASYIHLGVFMQDEFVGVLQFGYAMNPASAGSVVADTEIDEYLELNRMWLDDKAPKNSESKAISYAIKVIKRAYPKIKWIQSFADERCGKFGIVYQASNFKYYGEHESDFWEYKGIVYHNIQMTVSPGTRRYSREVAELQQNKDKAKRLHLRQFRYIFFIDKKSESKARLQQKPYEKWYKNEDKTEAEDKADYGLLMRD